MIEVKINVMSISQSYGQNFWSSQLVVFLTGYKLMLHVLVCLFTLATYDTNGQPFLPLEEQMFSFEN